MYIQRMTMYPALNNGPELRELLRQQVENIHTNGKTATLTADVLNGHQGASLSVHIVHNTLEDWESFRRSGDASRLEMLSKARTLVSRPIAIRLDEMVVRPSADIELPTPPFWSQRITGVRKLGKRQELRKFMEDQVARMTSLGRRTHLVSSLYGTEEPSYSMISFHQNMSDLDELRAYNQEDPEYAKAIAQLPELIAKPPIFELSEVLTRLRA